MNADVLRAFLKAEKVINKYENGKLLNSQERPLVVYAIAQLFYAQPEIEVSDYLISITISAVQNEIKKIITENGDATRRTGETSA